MERVLIPGLANVYITNWKITKCLMGISTINGTFQVRKLLVYQRVMVISGWRMMMIWGKKNIDFRGSFGWWTMSGIPSWPWSRMIWWLYFSWVENKYWFILSHVLLYANITSYQQCSDMFGIVMNIVMEWHAMPSRMQQIFVWFQQNELRVWMFPPCIVDWCWLPSNVD